MDENERVYQEALDCIDELVEHVIEICGTVARDNDYEKEWVLSQFAKKFNKRKRQEDI